MVSKNLHQFVDHDYMYMVYIRSGSIRIQDDGQRQDGISDNGYIGKWLNVALPLCPDLGKL